MVAISALSDHHAQGIIFSTKSTVILKKNLCVKFSQRLKRGSFGKKLRNWEIEKCVWHDVRNESNVNNLYKLLVIR